MPNKTVIVCSYGPKKATHGALRRLRSMLSSDDQLIVYAGTRAGVADAGKTKGVEVIEEHGRTGLLAALEASTGDHLLHLTDGITLTVGTLEKLFAAAARTGKLVTPWTNDLGTDHYVGPLPTHGNTIQVLSQLGRQQEEASVQVLRPMCVGGTRAQILGLVPHHLSYPTAVLRLVHDDCIAVAGTVAAHDGSASARMLPPEGPEGRPLLVASMIVRDEEFFLADCLATLSGFVDRIDLCDTGSTDRTLEIAREFGCNIIERPWRDDFGWARNEVLELAKDAWWSLWIDADERLSVDDPVQTRRELATAVDHFDVLSIPIVSAGGADMEGPLTRWTTGRLLRPSKMHYEGALHEQIVSREPGVGVSTTALDGVEINHLGYTAEVISVRDKKNRNLSIARTRFDENPDDPVAALQYARSLWMAGEGPEVRLAALEQAREGFTNAPPAQVAFVSGLLARTVQELGDAERGWDLAVEALDIIPADDTAFSVLLTTGRQLGRHDEILARLDAYAHGPSLRPAMEDPPVRARNRADAIRLLREAGQSDLALQHTTELLSESRRDFPHWELIIDGLLETRTPEQLVTELHHLLTSTADGTWARPLATRIRRDVTLGLIEAHLAAGGQSAEPVRVGLTLAMLMPDTDALRRIATSHGHQLPDEDRKAMADALRGRGHAEIADILDTTTVDESDSVFTFKT